MLNTPEAWTWIQNINEALWLIRMYSRLLSIEDGFPIHTQKDFFQCEAMLNRNQVLMT